MKKMLVMMAIGFGMIQSASASPIVDFIVGIGLIANGGVFEVLRGNAAKDKDNAQAIYSEHSAKYGIARDGYYFYAGSASWELFINGNTANYRGLVSLANTYAATANSEAILANAESPNISDNWKKENIYKGVSLTSFGIGSVFILKGAVTYFAQRTQSAKAQEKYKWARNIDMVPTHDMAGAQVVYSCRWGG